MFCATWASTTFAEIVGSAPDFDSRSDSTVSWRSARAAWNVGSNSVAFM
jgi:hypothetical protein